MGDPIKWLPKPFQNDQSHIVFQKRNSLHSHVLGKAVYRMQAQPGKTLNLLPSILVFIKGRRTETSFWTSYVELV